MLGMVQFVLIWANDPHISYATKLIRHIRDINIKFCFIGLSSAFRLRNLIEYPPIVLFVLIRSPGQCLIYITTINGCSYNTTVINKSKWLRK